jgi:hypothetical protein
MRKGRKKEFLVKTRGKHAFRCSSENSMEMVIVVRIREKRLDIHRIGSGLIESGSGSSILG